jgi:1,2-diacylglycerol 3-beta-galactosyltransferase
MDHLQTVKPRILFLFSDTGGGHRSAMEAIIEALFLEYGDQFNIETVDIFKDYAPRPLKFMPEWYPSIVKLPQAWGFGYKITNGHRRARLITASAWPYLRQSIRKLVTQHPSDLVVSVHPLATAPTLRALGKDGPPFLTVVTDLVSTHALWYHRRADLCVVPTQAALQRALNFGLKPEQVRQVGLPVADRFCKPPGDQVALRQNLGWPQDCPVILLVGGGDGMGPIEKTSRAIALAGLDAALVVIAGRNQPLKTRLETMRWPIPTLIYGFVREMPEFMRAADILVTKAGPGTISEALNAGLPMILYSRLPGQEDGNVSYVESEGAGVWAPQPEKIVATLRTWIEHPQERGRAATACRRLANPQAARQIAHILAEYVGITCQPSA